MKTLRQSLIPLCCVLSLVTFPSACEREQAPSRQVAPPAPTTTTAPKISNLAPPEPSCEDGMDCAKGTVAVPSRNVTAPPARVARPPVQSARPRTTPRVAPAAVAKTVPAPSERDVLKQLERNPGSTPALVQVAVKPGPKHASLEGKPGPSPGFGPDDAPVRVFIFSDFQCPVCRRVVEPVKKLARDYGDKVQIVFMQNALKMHRQAEIAAAASMAAFNQGKFWDYHDALFSNRNGLSRENLIAVAESLKLDIARFNKDLDDPKIRAQIAYERDLAAKLGATGTPGFMVNGQKLVGWGSYMGFRSMVDKALRATTALAGTPKAMLAKVATAAAGDDGKRFAELYWGITIR